MADVKDLLARKGSVVFCIAPAATVLEATQLMNRHKIGAIMVTEGGEGTGRILGIFTERDVLRRVVAEEMSPTETLIEEVMTPNVACATYATSIEEARTVMKNRRIRHLPVCTDEGKLLGMISIGDLNAWEADGQEMTIHFLNEYIHGRV